MKITHRGVIDLVSKEEKEFYTMLKQVLKKLFEVNVGELPIILTTLGIELPVKVEEYHYHDTHDAEMKFETGETVIFHGGYMMSPYPYVTCDEEEWILTDKDRKVKSLERMNDILEEIRKEP